MTSVLRALVARSGLLWVSWASIAGCFLFSSFSSFPSVAHAKFQKQELQVPGGITGVEMGDLDGDGRVDLVVSYVRGAGPLARRFISVFYRGETGFASRPDVSFKAPRYAAAFDVGNALAGVEDEIVYLSSSGVYAQTFSERKPSKPTKILDVSTVASEPQEDELIPWDFLRQVQSDYVLIVPAVRDIRLFKRAQEVWKPWSTVRVDRLSYYDAATNTYRRSRRGGASGRLFSLQVTTVVPNLELVDQNGDGRVDLVTFFEDRVAIYPQNEDGSLSSTPAFRRYFAVRTPQELETKDSSIEASVQDLDGDRVADLVLTKIGGGISNLATEVRLYRGRPEAGFDKEPAQVFRDEGFAVLVEFQDVNGDGTLEMVHPLSEVSIMALSRAMLQSKVSLDLRIRTSAPPPLFFNPRPVQTLTTRLGLDLTVGATMRGGAPLFGHDFDGDGQRDVVLAQGAEQMVLHRGLGKKDELFEEEGHIILSAPGSQKTVILPTTTGVGERKSQPGPDVLVYYVQRPQLGGKLVVFRNTYGR